jgi:DNA repair ATPase RecN
MEKVEKRDARIQQLEKEHLEKHTKLGETQSKLAKVQSDLQSSQDEIEKLHQSAVSCVANVL